MLPLSCNVGSCHDSNMFPLCNSRVSFAKVGVLGTHCSPVLSGGNGSSSTDEDVMSFRRPVGSLIFARIVSYFIKLCSMHNERTFNKQCYTIPPSHN